MKEIMMRKNIVSIILLALIAMTGSLRAELDSVNLFDAHPNLSDWTVVGGATAVDNTTSSTGDSSLGYNAAWACTVLGISDGNEDYALGLPDMLPAASDTDYFTGAWVKDDAAAAAAFLYFSTYNGGTGGWAETCAFPTPYIMTGAVPTTDWVFYRSIINSGNTYGNGMGFTVNCSGPINVDDVVAAEITDPNTPHVLAWGDTVKVNGALDLRGYVEAGNGSTAGTITSTTWSKVSGPGGVAFGDASSVVTTATFDTAGSYTLQLQAVDSNAKTVTVTADYVVEPGADPPSVPSPGDASEHVSFDTDLGWTPGAGAQTQKVFFDVGIVTPTTEVASGDGSLATVANSLLNGGSPLAANTYYSWQVVGYIGATPYEGPIWTFKTAIGLAYHWPLNGNLNEVIIGNNGDPNYYPITYVEGADGVAGNAISVTTENWVTSTSNIGITGNTPRTLICWFKAPSTDLMMSPATFGGTVAERNLFEVLLLATGFAEGHFWGYQQETGGTISYAADTWYMGAVVHDGTTASYYQNAAFSSSKAITLNTTDSPAEIGGCAWPQWSSEYAGEIDDVRIYDVALTQPELEVIYLEMIGADPYTTVPSPADDAEHVSVDTDLGWIPGIGIDTQEVYFDAGTDPPTTLVASGDDTLATVANSALNGGSPLAMNQDYSWQVVSYIDATPYEGPIWTFKTTVGLAYHWPLNGDSSEVIAGNNGVPTGTISYVTGADGVAGNAMSVTTADYLTSTSNLGLTGNAPRTVNFWFKVPDGTTARVPFSSGSNAALWNLFEVYNDTDSTSYAHVWGHAWAPTTNTHPVNEWVMATMVYGGGTSVEMYQNATLNSTLTTPILTTADSPAYIGGGGWGPAFDGQIDDVRVYDVVLDETEIAQLYIDMLPDVDYICTDTDRPAMDFTNDCVVDMADFAVFALEWLECGRFPQSTCP